MIRYKFAKGQDVSNMDILSYNVVSAFFVSLGKYCIYIDLIHYVILCNKTIILCYNLWS